jgi:signal transduction histidine kinase
MGDVAVTSRSEPTLEAALDRVLALVHESGPAVTVPERARAEARGAALALLEACGGGRQCWPLVVLGYAADLLCAVAVDLAANRRQAQRLIDELELQTDVPRAALGREVLRAGRLLELPVEIAFEVQLALLLTFTGAETVSLWTSDAGADLRRVSHVGELDGTSSRLQAAARAVLQGTPRDLASSSTLALRVDSLTPSAAALVVHGVHARCPVAGPMLATAAPVLAALLDRQALLAREHSQESMVSTVERRLARLRFDLHDGPQQDVHLLAQDLRLFRDQLRPMIAGNPDRDRVVGRLDDLEAQLVALDGDLRRLLTTVQSPLLTPGSLPEALAQLADAFAARTGIVPKTEISVGKAVLSDSQQITLLSLVRESLSNIRQHSEATEVTIEISSDPSGVTVQISDDGSGFDPEAALVRAARAGRLGLVGMHERVRMLGGSTQIDSCPGGPTVISATLPPWPDDQAV